MRKLTYTLLAASLLSLSALARAEEAAKPKVPIPALDDVLEAWGLTLNGYLDTSFSHLSSNGTFTSGVNNRVFDARRDSFSVHQAAFTLAKQPKEGFGALVNLIAGQDADLIHSFGTAGTTNFDPTQAFVQYAKGPLTVIGGKFITSAGAEVINPTQDTNFSRSILFGYAIPFTHTGLRAMYAVNDTLSLMVGVNNGWDQLRDMNSAKTVEVGALLAPLKNLSVSAGGHFGKEQADGVAGSVFGGLRSLVDVVVTYKATDKLTLILNPDWGAQKNTATLVATGNNTSRWYGLAGYAVYQFNDLWRGSLRAEYFDDKDGYRTGVKQKWKEVTYTMAYLPTKNIELRGEVRLDRSNAPSFVDPNGVTSGKTQTSIALEALFKF
jgi:hypothetical protein